MPDLVIAARDAPAAERFRADLVCDGTTDVALLAKALDGTFDEVALTTGTFNANGGHAPDGSRYLHVAGGVTVRGAGPGLTRLVAENEPCRVIADAPDATVANLGGFGYVGLEVHADRFTAEDVYVTHSLDGKTYLDFGRKGGCTAAFMAWGRKGKTLRDLTFRRCSVERSYHHGFSLNLAGASEGGGFADVLFDQCHAIACGSGMEGGGKRDWSCGFDIPDAVFAELHTTGGSLTAKFDRDEELVLSLAAHYRAEQFTAHDVQRWTGWHYHRARRTLLGYVSRGVRYPGLLDKSPALSLVDELVTTTDGEGRDVRRRMLVFVFDEEVHRKAEYAGQVWLEAGALSVCGTRQPAANGAANGGAPSSAPGSGNGGEGAEIDPAVCGKNVCSDTGVPQGAAPAATGGPGTAEAAPIAKTAATPRASPAAAASPAAPASKGGIDPRRFAPIGGPAWEPCAVCGTRPSHYREKWARGVPERRLLCKQCFATAVERERRRVPPLPAVIDPAALRRAGAAIGRCDVCGLEAARWHGDGGRVCEACYQREVRRGIEAGKNPVPV